MTPVPFLAEPEFSKTDSDRQELSSGHLLRISVTAQFPPARAWSLSHGKRYFDVAISAIVLLVFSIPMALIALCIRLSSDGPAIFVQKRVGRRGRLFSMYKFRTMTVATRSPGPGLTHTGDSRITSVGRWLRRFKFDELPQFYNVLRGDMSVVGPRPKLARYADRLTLAYRPGITGAASLAFRCEEDILACVHAHELESFYQDRIKPMKANIDERYMRTATLFSDLRIVLATLLASLVPGAYRALEHHEVKNYLAPERSRVSSGWQPMHSPEGMATPIHEARDLAASQLAAVAAAQRIRPVDRAIST
jgi:lipopolysaccharide/colanic/teichoic acid biosynthesis glycosyltransferase